MFFPCRLEYSIEQGNEDGTFNTDSQTGTITLAKDLDFDTMQSYRLLVSARNRDVTCCRRARIRVIVQVIRNRIDFPDPVGATVSEFAAVNSEVITFQASGGAGGLEYSITDGNLGNAFSIGLSSGVITVNEMLDFEARASYTLTISVESVGTNVNGSAEQVVTVLDENEPASFLSSCAASSTCAATVPEDIGESTSLGLQVMAEDPDLDTLPNGMIEYRINDLTLPFTVNQAGTVHRRSGVQLDRETEDSYSITIIVEDQGIPSLSISTVVQVTVSDVNDNVPFFIQGPTTVEIEENSQTGSDIAQYIAEDNDIGSNAAIEYTLSPQTFPFELDPVSGVLSVSGPIDYEDTQQYNVTVTASNPDGTAGSIITTINVIDLNDNDPVFSPDAYSEMVIEHSSQGSSVINATASDADSGSNGEIRFAITSGNAENAFAIDSISGALTVNNDIDRETTTSFTLRIQARDLGNPSRSSFATVTIEVVDINDNAPQFTPDLYTIALREDTSVGFDILSVFAFDPDEPGNPNSEIVYSISDGNTNGTFTLSSSSGLLELAKTLDFEAQPSYTLTVSATDQGSPQLTDTATINIEVMNVNEFAPVLNGSQTVNISELSPVPQDVVSFTAQDLDAGATVVYEIVSGNNEGKFDIDSATGLVMLVEPLDFETTKFYEIRISANDGQNTDTANLTVYVIDENEFTPEFTGNTEFAVDEEMPTGTLVGTVTAIDRDGSSMNSEITYLLQGSVITQYISLNASSGEIRTLEQLNREQLTQIFPPPASQRPVDVIARDGGSPSLQNTTTITVILVDINDNAPVFSDSYENTFRENLPAGMLVFQLFAADIDLGQNAVVQYSFAIPGVPNPPFDINTTTGVVQTTEQLDREEQEFYNFTFTATDQGDISMSSTVNGMFTVLDENDNAPSFTMPIYEMALSESVQIGTLDLQLSADDPDKGLNGQVQYVLIGQEDFEDTVEDDFLEVTFFEIEADSGILNHITPFDFELQTFINLTIMAHDLGVPRRSSFAEVHISITNFDESPPLFSEINCNQEVPEDIAVGEVVRSCVAVDPDNTTVDGEVGIVYTLIASNPSVAEYFEVNHTTGEIKTIRELDFDAGPTTFGLSILAQDAANRFALSQPAVIKVTDVNDNEPQFRNNPYEYALTNSRLQSYVRVITLVDAFDLDSQQSGNGKIVFSIDRISRAESDMEAVLEITATDGGSPQKSATTTLTISYETPCVLQKYNIDSTNGDVTADTLCSVEITPVEANITLSQSHSISCTVIRNGATTYQWIHNGSIITGLVTLPQAQQQATRNILSTEFDDGGEYSCKVTTAAGSLQAAPPSTVNVQG